MAFEARSSAFPPARSRADWASRPAAQRSVRDATLIFLAALTLYVVTLAPTVLWGDDAEFQRLAWTGGEVSLGRGHQLWVAVARGFAIIPWGDPARRANLVSAVFGALTLVFVHASILHLTRRRDAAVLGSAALAVSHTFWLYAVRAEVYSMHTAFLASVIWLAVQWADDPGRMWVLASGAFLAGFSLLNHVLMLTTLPSLAYLVGWRATPPRWRAWAVASGAFLLGIAPYLLTRLSSPSDISLVKVVLNIRPFSVVPRELALWAGFLGFQFPLSLILIVPGLIWLWRMDSQITIFLVLAYLGSAGFAISFRVPDQYAFYLPSYVVAALLIGAGLAALLQWRSALASRAGLIALTVLMIALPIGLYRTTPVVLSRLGVNPLGVRSLPGRETYTFFLWPPKRDYWGARQFAEEALTALPPNAVLLADWSPLQALLYLQVVEGRRADVSLVQIYAGQGQQVPFLLDQSQTRPVFIAGTGRYYDLDEVLQYFEVKPFEPIYRLERRP